MPFPAKPASRPAWTATNPGVRVEPSAPYKNTGWFSNIRPPYQFMNWLFYNLGVEWLGYFEGVTDALKNAGAQFDFTIGTGGDFADINAAMAAPGVFAGARLYILNSLAFAMTQQITKNQISIDMGPGTVLSDAGALIGIQVSATRCRIKGGKMSGFATEALLIDAGSNYTMIGEMLFQGNAADVNDLNLKTAMWGIINE